MNNIFKDIYNKWFDVYKYECKLYKKDNSYICFYVYTKEEVEEYINWLSSDMKENSKVIKSNSNLINVNKNEITELEYREISRFGINIFKPSIIQFTAKQIISFTIFLITIFSAYFILSVPNVTFQNIYKLINSSVNIVITFHIIYIGFFISELASCFFSFETPSPRIIVNEKSVLSELFLLIICPMSTFIIISSFTKPVGLLAQKILFILANL